MLWEYFNAYVTPTIKHLNRYCADSITELINKRQKKKVDELENPIKSSQILWKQFRFRKYQQSVMEATHACIVANIPRGTSGSLYYLSTLEI